MGSCQILVKNNSILVQKLFKEFVLSLGIMTLIVNVCTEQGYQLSII